MSSYSYERLYKRAREKYDVCESIIIEMADLIKRVRPEFSTDVALAQFDLILQACMLNSALNDGDFVPLEKDFIVDIVKHTDIIPLINEALVAQGVGKIDWKTISSFSAETMKKASVLAAMIVKPYAEEFVDNFAIVDKAVKVKNYGELLRAQAELILLSLVGIDGDKIQSKKARGEASAGAKMYNLLVNKRWKKIISEG